MSTVTQSAHARLPLWRSRAVALVVLAIVTLALALFVIWAQFNATRTNRAHPVASKRSVPPVPALLDQRIRPISPETAVELNTARPIVAGKPMPATTFHYLGPPEMLERATNCLAAAGWYEAGDDPDGQRAVAQVILNRARHPSFPASICGVVFQGSTRTTGCQFTFTCDGAIVARTPSSTEWKRARTVATAALGGAVDARVGYATFYHANYVVPYWADSFDKIAQVGAHLFYRWQGYWGTRGAFRQQPSGDEPIIAAMARFAGNLSDTNSIPAAVVDAAAAPEAALNRLDLNAPPIAVEGVREKSLRGALVRGQATDHFFLQLDPETFPGNYATAAVALCKGKPSCTVFGWRDPAQMAAAAPLTDAQRAALSFFFVQNGDLAFKALWNCQQIKRKNPAQCLGPTGPLPNPS